MIWSESALLKGVPSSGLLSLHWSGFRMHWISLSWWRLNTKHAFGVAQPPARMWRPKLRIGFADPPKASTQLGCCVHGTRLNLVQSRIPGLNLVLALIHWGADIVQNYWQDVARTGCILNVRIKCKDEEQEKQEWLPQHTSVNPSISHCEQLCVCPSTLYQIQCQTQKLLVTLPYHIPVLKSAPLFSTQEYNCQLKICKNSLIRKELKLKLYLKKGEG